MAQRSRRVLPYVLGAVVVVAAVVMARRGWSFYGLSLEDRVEHPDFRKLRPSGIIGMGYGFVAATIQWSAAFVYEGGRASKYFAAFALFRKSPHSASVRVASSARSNE